MRWTSFKAVSHSLLQRTLRATIFSQCLIKYQRGIFVIKNLTAGLAHCCRFCIIHCYQIAWRYLRNHLRQHYILYFRIWLRILEYLCQSQNLKRLEMSVQMSVEMNLSVHQNIDELYKNIVLNLIADQSTADQMKVLFELKIMNVNCCIKWSYMSCNEELGS